jgi:NADPH-dependent glutamate synthase beta subunit-like oxidoreductase
MNLKATVPWGAGRRPTNMATNGKWLEDLVAFVESKMLPSGFKVDTRSPVYDADSSQIVAEFDIEITGKLGSGKISWLIECRDRQRSAPASWIELPKPGQRADEGCVTHVQPDDLKLRPACLSELEDKLNLHPASNVDLFRRWANDGATEAHKRIQFHFFQSPSALLGKDRLQQVAFERNRLSGPPFAHKPIGTGEITILECNLLFRSIGYFGKPLPGAPFDAARGVIPHTAGRVGDEPGLYAVGWIKRGPSGIIGTNRADPIETVQTIAADLNQLSTHPQPGFAGLESELSRRGAQVASYADWRRIDAEERRLGAAINKPREKLTSIHDMLAIARATPNSASS